MDWGFLDIFKKADFDKLMIAAAITGWVFHHYYPDNIWVFGLAVLCTIYCLLGFIVYVYNWSVNKRQKRLYKKKEKETKENNEYAQRLQAQFVYDRLGSEKQHILSLIVKKGAKSSYSDVYILQNDNDNNIIISQLRCALVYDDKINFWVNIEETMDTFSIYIKPPLNEIIEEKIKTNAI